MQLNLFGFPEGVEVEVVTSSYKVMSRVLACTRLRLPGEGKRELSGNEIINQEAVFAEDSSSTFIEQENIPLHEVWKESLYHKNNLGVLQCKLEWVDSAHLKLPLT